MKLEVLRNKLESENSIRNLEEIKEGIKFPHKTICQTVFQFKINNIQCEISWTNGNSSLRLTSDNFTCWFDTLEVSNGRLNLYDADYCVIVTIPSLKKRFENICFETRNQLKDYTGWHNTIVDLVWKALIDGDLKDDDINKIIQEGLD